MSFFLTSISSCFADTLAPVDVFAEPILSYKPLQNITILDATEKASSEENKKYEKQVINSTLQPIVYTYNSTQGFYHFDYPVGGRLNMIFQHAGYQTSQSGTYTITKSGYVDQYGLISWQALPRTLWAVIKNIILYETHTSIKKDTCQVIMTVSAYHKTLNDDPQGEEGATVQIEPLHGNHSDKLYDVRYYLDIFMKKPFPWPGLKKTSKDGGVIFVNVKPGNYKVITKKEGVKFSTPEFKCNPSEWKGLNESNIVINLSPPQGPTVIHS